MYYQQKRTIVSLAEGILLLAAYCIYVLGKVNAGAVAPGDLHFFAVAMLWFIGIGVAAGIVIQIVFHILLSVAVAVREREKDEKTIEAMVSAEMVEDERDKMIDLKCMRISFAVAMAGFVAGLVLLALNGSAVVMLNILFGGIWLGTIAEGIAKLAYYKVGMKHD